MLISIKYYYININLMEVDMALTKPKVSEISIGLEINSYACAEK